MKGLNIKLQIVQIGNSLGVRIPKALLKQCGFKDSIIVKVENNRLVLIPDNEPRRGWGNVFKEMAQVGDNKLVDADRESTFDRDEWEW